MSGFLRHRPPLFHMCQVANVAMETQRLILNQFKSVFTARCVCIAQTMLWIDVCASVCLPSHAGIVPKRLYIFSKFFHRRVAAPFYFFHTKRDGNTPTKTTPLMGASNARGIWKKSQFSTNISLYLGTDARQSHSYYGTQIGNRTQAFEWYRSEWPWVTSNPDFKVMISFNVK